MYTSDQLEALLKTAMGQQETKRENNKQSSKNGKNNESKKNNLSASQILVIGGILGGALEVESILVDKDQTVQILLSGTLKQKTQLEKIMDQVGTLPFDEVMQALMGRLK